MADLAATTFKPLPSVSLRQWFSANKVSETTNMLRSREHKYPFIIVTTPKGEQSIFFSRKLSEKIGDVTELSSKSLGQYQVYEVTYDDGREARLKLGLDSEVKLAVTEDFFD